MLARLEKRKPARRGAPQLSASDLVERLGLPSQVFPERKMPPGILSRCLAIINPAHHSQCREGISLAFDGVVWAHANPQLFGAAAEADMKGRCLAIARAFTVAAVLMRAQPWLWSLGRPSASVDEEADAEGEWIRVSDYLASAAGEAMRAAPRRTRPSNMLKRFCALFAFDLIERFGGERATLTIDGPFFRLASVLYEAAAGTRDANLERACRLVFRSSHQARR